MLAVAQHPAQVAGQVRVARHVQHGPAGAGGAGGDLQPVQHQVRGQPQQRHVLAAARLALGAVADHDPRPARGDGRELAVHRERRAAAAGQPGPPDLGDQRGRRQRGQRAEPGQVRGGPRVGDRAVRDQPRQPGGRRGARPRPGRVPGGQAGAHRAPARILAARSAGGVSARRPAIRQPSAATAAAPQPIVSQASQPRHMSGPDPMLCAIATGQLA